ncbi:MAG: rhamnulokinase [Actinobacteria bacterium]|nr:rhamnulokinase [Actinomycetota bacterium]
MNNKKNYLAIDFGASNGRAIIGQYDGKTLGLNEVHRFENRPVFANETLYWDILRLYSELKTGIAGALKISKKIESLGVETWGCDFGLLDKNKELISNPVHYRDKRTRGLSKKINQLISNEEIYKKTAAQNLEINSLYQLYSMKISGSTILENAHYFLQIADLFNFFLTGNIICEYSNATLTQLLNQKNKKWEKSIIGKLGLPENLFVPVTEPGTVIGSINNNLCDELNCKPITVSLPCYDTTSEITAIPVSKNNRLKNWAYLNCGTWAMVGIISDSPIVTEEGFKLGFGNEGGFAGKYHYLKNMVGLWIIQECRKKWIKDTGKDIKWDDLMNLASISAEKNIFIDIDDPIFEREIFDMPDCVISYCKKTGQEIPQNVGEIVKVFYDSITLKYLLNLRKLEKIVGRKIELLHLVGGGSQDKLICQSVSDATGLPLIAGPAETTTTGNLLAQMIAADEINSIEDGREIIINSISLSFYEPINTARWTDKYEKYKKILNLEF